MGIIEKEIGRKIRFYRKQKNMTLQELACLINKSKPCVSKYELGQISIDIGTIYEIARALNIHVEQLLYAPPTKPMENKEDRIPAFFKGLSQFYIYMFDGRSNTLNRCVVDVLERTEYNTYKVMMYLNISGYEEYQNCENTYYGYLKHYDALSHLLLQHQDSPIEQVTITILASYLNTNTKWGMFFGLSTRPLFPCAAKALFSRKKLPENQQLYRELMISKEDIRLLKLYNMLIVT